MSKISNKNEAELGDEVTDIVSGFKGIVTSVTHYLNGCTRLCVQPPIDKDCKESPSAYFDIEQLKIVQKGKVVLKSSRSERTGGDRIDPPARPNR